MFLILISTVLLRIADCKEAKPYNETRPSSKYDNPNFIRDRYHVKCESDSPTSVHWETYKGYKVKYSLQNPDEIFKPMMPESWVNRFNKPYNPAWMDYCDPYHCNDYHKLACGLNRRTMRFKWFQSKCHIILNNLCSQYRGALEYDVVEDKFCLAYVIFTRSICPSVCPDIEHPVCAVSTKDNRVVMFKNGCFLERRNCKEFLEEFEAVSMKICLLSKVLK